MNLGRFKIGLILIAGASLSSCSDKSESDAFADMNLSVGFEQSDKPFGEGFDAKFRADPNSEPTPVREGDVPPVSYTTEPVQID